jgi:RNA polymerase sigma-70 factor (ECF subfamily)
VPRVLPSTERVTDAELVERALAGEASAFGELVERHHQAVFRAVLAALDAQVAEADDVAQEAWVAIHRRLGTFRGEASFRTWALAVAWRKALDRRRGLKSVLRRFVPIEADDTLTAAAGQRGSAPFLHLVGPSPERVVLHSEKVTAARKVIRTLPRKLRDPLLLVGSGDLSYEEIARLLGVPIGTVKWRVSEARRLVKTKLARLGY